MIFQKLRNWKKFVMKSEPAQNCGNNAIFVEKLYINRFDWFKIGISA